MKLVNYEKASAQCRSWEVPIRNRIDSYRKERNGPLTQRRSAPPHSLRSAWKRVAHRHPNAVCGLVALEDEVDVEQVVGGGMW